MRNRSCGHYCATHSVSRSGRRRWAVTNATRVQTGSSSHQLQFIPLHSGRLPVTPESTDGQHIVDWRPWLIGATRSASRGRCDDGDRQRSFNTSDGLATISCRAADTACGIVCDVLGPAPLLQCDDLARRRRETGVTCYYIHLYSPESW